jgi:hypothetical protein
MTGAREHWAKDRTGHGPGPLYVRTGKMLIRGCSRAPTGDQAKNGKDWREVWQALWGDAAVWPRKTMARGLGMQSSSADTRGKSKRERKRAAGSSANFHTITRLSFDRRRSGHAVRVAQLRGPLFFWDKPGASPCASAVVRLPETQPRTAELVSLSPRRGDAGVRVSREGVRGAAAGIARPGSGAAGEPLGTARFGPPGRGSLVGRETNVPELMRQANFRKDSSSLYLRRPAKTQPDSLTGYVDVRVPGIRGRFCGPVAISGVKRGKISGEPGPRTKPGRWLSPRRPARSRR